MKMIKFSGITILCSLIYGCGQVSNGEYGIQERFGKVISEQPLVPGLYFYNPIITSLITYDTKIQTCSCKCEAFTKDIQRAELVLKFNYFLNPNKIIEVHRTIGKDYFNKILNPIIPSLCKNVFGQWEATDVIAKRNEATELINLSVKTHMQKYGIEIVATAIDDIGFSDKFERAVEDKEVARQDAIKAKNETAKIEEQSRQTLIKAKAEAEAMEVRAKALEKNKNLVEYNAVEKWDGKLPVYMLGNTVPFINLHGDMK